MLLYKYVRAIPRGSFIRVFLASALTLKKILRTSPIYTTVYVPSDVIKTIFWKLMRILIINHHKE